MDHANNSEPIFSSHANGKLLISGEYAVLHGAKALSVPLKKGQSFQVFNNSDDLFLWQSYHPNGIWHEVTFNSSLSIAETTSLEFGQHLKQVLYKALEIAQLPISFLSKKRVITQLEFLPEWGLGSSSTFIYNVSSFFHIDPWELLKKTFKGSGYDIASAKINSPVFYQLKNDKPQYTSVKFYPAFHSNIYFVYLGKKIKSSLAIKDINQKIQDDKLIQRISTISSLLTTTDSLNEFEDLINEHEDIIGNAIGKFPIKRESFRDFKGSIKSLGAWGGDFAMVVCSHDSTYVRQYFAQKNLHTLFNFNELILNPQNSSEIIA